MPSGGGHKLVRIPFEFSSTGTGDFGCLIAHPSGAASSYSNITNLANAAETGDGEIATLTGRVTYVVVRQNASGTITAGDFYIITNGVRDPAMASSPREDHIAKITPSSWTGSATDAIVDTPLTGKPVIQGGSLLLLADITTASGAWTLSGFLELEV